jgi:DNA gyrase subunit A
MANEILTDLVDELGENFIEYAVAVNTDRAIPDATSGLKPVAKRIIYGAYDQGFYSKKPHVKCANIVGNVMADWHPHGDSSIYGALVRLSQEWVMRYPLIDFHGSKGNRDGDGPAAYRYTEARLSTLVEEGMLMGMKKGVVDTIPNYSETKDEPVTLPSYFPNLLCNPNTGIGVAMACNWAPHNLNEVAKAIFDYIDGKEPMLPGPDFPTGGIIINKDDISSIMRTGHGTVRIRGKYDFEDNNIVFYEIPYGVLTEALMEQIGKACDEGNIEGIKHIRNESTRKKGFRLVLECGKDANFSRIITQLFKYTDLQTSFSYNMVGLVGKTPTELNLKDCCKIYVDHNSKCIIRETEHDLKKTQNKLEIDMGLLKALEDIDNIIALIKGSKSAAAAKTELCSRYNFTEPQAQAIVDMKLGRLAGLEKIELNEEIAALQEEIKHYNAILENPTDELLIRLRAIVDKYGDARRTELAQIAEPKDTEEKKIASIPPEKCVVILTEGGSIKRINTTSFRAQRRGGKGVKTQDDITSMVLRTNTIDSLMVFSDQGNMYRLIVDDIPEGTNTSKGTPVKALLSMDSNENPTIIYSIYHDTDAKFIMFVTKQGYVKRTSIDEYSSIRKKTGTKALNLHEGDSLAAVFLVSDEQILMLTKNGYAIRCKGSEFPASGRVTMGCKGINLQPNDSVICALPIRDETDSVAIFSKEGLGRRVALSAFPIQARNGRGTVYAKDANCAGACLVSDDDTILICGNKSSLCIKAKDLPAETVSRTTMGCIVIKDNIVTGVSKV